MTIELTNNSGDNYLKMKPRTYTGDAKWKDIEDLINRWARRNPRGAWELESYIKELQAGLSDKKFGASSSGDSAMGRIGLAIHPEMMQYIQAFYPNFLDTKDEMHEFMNKFPKFRIPEKS